ncbi:MAG: hypothetical protein IKN87_04430 [Bacilli bacterium]|nr:hypothetical protein [Bacilli bacterium]
MLFKTKLNVVNTLKILSIFLSINVINIINYKYKINDKVNFIYIVFIILAHFLGVILNFYDKIKYYDKFVHFLFGIVASYILSFFIKGKYKIIKIIIVVIFLATMWEIYEYICSILFHIDPQNNLTTGVNDTMQDIIVAFIGSIIAPILCRKL